MPPISCSRSRQRVEAAVDGRAVRRWGCRGACRFADQSFDAVVSAFGAMFAADQERAASEMIRVCRRGRRVGLANWTPEGFIGQLFGIVGKHAPQGAGRRPVRGARARASRSCLAPTALWVDGEARGLPRRTPMDWVDKLRASYAPVLKTFALLDAAGKRALRADLLELVARFNRARDSTMLVDAEYLEVVITRR